MREYMRGYRQRNNGYREWKKEYMREYMKKYNQTVYLKIPKNRIHASIASGIWLALKENKAGKRWEELVGYTLGDLMVHLERKFDEKMSWENYGIYWSIDHITPKSIFKYKTAKDSEFKMCWALENLQPLEKIANIKKSNKFN